MMQRPDGASKVPIGRGIHRQKQPLQELAMTTKTAIVTGGGSGMWQQRLAGLPRMDLTRVLSVVC
jgi:hypothetical protein